MKKLKILYIALIALVAGVLGACSTDFEPGPQASGPQVSFLPTNPSTIEFEGVDGEGTKSLTLSRVEKENALTVNILADMPADYQSLFSIPETVTFAAGEATAELVFTVDHAKFEDGKTYTVGFYVDESVSTPYGYAEWTVDFALNPWELMTDSKGNNAKGKFRGIDLVTGFYDLDPAVETDVNIYEHKNTKGLYKVENPWKTAVIAAAGLTTEEEAIASGFTFSETDFIIDCTNKDCVFFELQSVGFECGYGPIYVGSMYWYDQMYAGGEIGAQPGTLLEGVITLPTKQSFGMEPGYSESMYYGNNDGMFRIVLPGVEVADYSLAVAYDGMDVAADNKTTTAKFKFTYGADVTGINYMIVDGNVESNPSEALTTLFTGEDENILSVEDFVKGDGEVGVKVGLERGVYTIVAAPADKDGALRAKEAIVKSFYFAGIGDAEEHPCEVTLEARKFSEVAELFPDANYEDYEAFAINIMGQEIKSMKYYFNKTSVISNAATQGFTLETILSEYGYAFGSDYLAVINSETGMATYFDDLEADTSYTFAVWAENNYGETAIVAATHTTDPIPYNGELAVGQYKMSCTMGAGTEDEYTFENIFKVSPVVGSDTDFLLSEFAIEDNLKWKASYDATASTLTLSGIANGLEDYGALFGNAYGTYDPDETMYYGIFSFATEASQTGKDPIVLKVDPTTKQLCGLNAGSSVYVYVFNASDSSLLGSVGAYDDTTVIAPYSETATASVKSVKSVTKPSVLMPYNRTNELVKLHSNLKSAKSKSFANGTIKRGVSTIKASVVENYTPVKSKGFKIKKVSGSVIVR